MDAMIGKTRQRCAVLEAEDISSHANGSSVAHKGEPVSIYGRSRGVLRLPEGARVTVSRRNSSPALDPFIAYYWRVSWDLRDRPPHLQETLPHPNIYMVFENDRLQVSGVSTGKFSRVLDGQSFAFGVKFKPGGFRPFLRPLFGSPASALTNRIVDANIVFGTHGDALEAMLLSCASEPEMVNAVEAFLLQRLPEPDKNVELAARIVTQILQEPKIKTVKDLEYQTGLGKRALQRLFREYVGVPPKWVIRRYRLHELIGRLHSDEALSWSEVALELGYFDQAHLINDFRAVTGYSPAEYVHR